MNWQLVKLIGFLNISQPFESVYLILGLKSVAAGV